VPTISTTAHAVVEIATSLTLPPFALAASVIVPAAPLTNNPEEYGPCALAPVFRYTFKAYVLVMTISYSTPAVGLKGNVILAEAAGGIIRVPESEMPRVSVLELSEVVRK
jgi:hypothetical protein